MRHTAHSRIGTAPTQPADAQWIRDFPFDPHHRVTMRRGIALRAAATGVVAALGLTACASTASTSAPPTAAETDSASATTEAAADVSTAAYVDVTTAHDSLAQVAGASGLRGVVLAFVLADSGACAPSWGGSATVDDSALAVQLADLRAAGGSVTVASGGASGEYLENACSDADSLAAAYARVLDANGSDHLEVDVEQAIPTATVIDALARLQHERGTAITLTLPVASATQGLTDDAVFAAARRRRPRPRHLRQRHDDEFPETGAWVGHDDDRNGPRRRTGGRGVARSRRRRHAAASSA